MNRMEKILSEMKEQGQKIIVCYYPLCDTLLEDQVEWAGKYFENGTTVLEMGLPFEDPHLDGKTVQDSMSRALSKYTVEDAFEVIRTLRATYEDKILQVMTYYKIIDRMGIESFAKRCADCGADAVLCPDIPKEKFPEMDRVPSSYGLLNLRFSPYHLNAEAEEDLIKNAKGYIFQQAVDGATGMQKTVSPQVGINARRLKELGINTPVLGGFGISNAQQAKEVCDMGTDGVIVGSAVITAIQNGKGEEFIRSLRMALD